MSLFEDGPACVRQFLALRVRSSTPVTQRLQVRQVLPNPAHFRRRTCIRHFRRQVPIQVFDFQVRTHQVFVVNFLLVLLLLTVFESCHHQHRRFFLLRWHNAWHFKFSRILLIVRPFALRYRLRFIALWQSHILLCRVVAWLHHSVLRPWRTYCLRPNRTLWCVRRISH